jgi:hypothetical protein
MAHNTPQLDRLQQELSKLREEVVNSNLPPLQKQWRLALLRWCEDLQVELRTIKEDLERNHNHG